VKGILNVNGNLHVKENFRVKGILNVKGQINVKAFLLECQLCVHMTIFVTQVSTILAPHCGPRPRDKAQKNRGD
jgi:cytoskeletal protein CcmA (bactofilin family)